MRPDKKMIGCKKAEKSVIFALKKEGKQNAV